MDEKIDEIVQEMIANPITSTFCSNPVTVTRQDIDKALNLIRVAIWERNNRVIFTHRFSGEIRYSPDDFYKTIPPF